MKALLIRAHGGPEVIETVERPSPEPGFGEVRLRVRAAGVNHLDIWVRKGVEGHEFPLPITPGCDMAGEIDKIGPGVEGVQVGDRVAVAPGKSCGRCDACAGGRQNLCRHYGIFGETCDGGDAEQAVVPAVNLLPMPPSMDFTVAAAAPLVFLTAWHMVVDRCSVRAGDDVLVHAAGSGVSMAAIQIAKMHGARVFTTVGADEKIAPAQALGAEVVINYKKADFGKEVRALTRKRGCDIIVDHVGGENITKSIRSLAAGGRVVTCGATSGYELKTDLRLVFFKNLSILGSTMGGLGEMRLVWSHICSGRLAPVIAAVMPLDEAREAHRMIEARAVFGKVVLTP
jgi:NADPH:quinone reductase-like Zn-dependent oxidoreductase